MGIFAVVLVVFVLLPAVLGGIAGRPAGLWVWAALVGLLAYAQAFGEGDELRELAIVIVILGIGGVPGVVAGACVRERARRYAARRRRGARRPC